ncbi:MAG: putative esterase [Verrucomicrobiaceae bacterium]|nr:putative esterase [Verrucomicrobiaceae bacterium]
MSNELYKTYLLIHGAYHGGWCWQFVADILRAQGHRVFTPTLPGHGDRVNMLSTYPDLNALIADVIDVIEREKLTDVIIVGHSLGGAVVTGVVDLVPEKIRHLIYLDAVILQPGRAVLDAAPSEVVGFYRSLLPEYGGNGAVPVPPMDFFGVKDETQIKFLLRNLTPQPVRTLFSKQDLTHTIGAGRPVTCINCTAPYFRQADSSRTFAKTQPSWNHVDLATGHDAMISAPQKLADLLLSIAE